MDAYQHRKKCKISSYFYNRIDINDQKVIVWEPTKFAAKLLHIIFLKSNLNKIIDYDMGMHYGKCSI